MFIVHHKNLSTYPVTKAKRDAGPQHMSEGKGHHPRRTIGKIRHQHTVY
jgi:hypothetical protein